MSTPSGKPGNPIDLSAHVPHKARERAAAERHPSEDKNDPLVRLTHQSEHTSLLARSGILSRMTAIRFGRLTRRRKRVDNPLSHRILSRVTTRSRLRRCAPGGLREHTERHAVGADESHLRSHDAVHPNIGRHEQPAAEHRDEIMSDRDLERLEASLRWLQRQESATRLPRATLLPCPGSLPSMQEAVVTAARGSATVFASPRSLEPERLPPPPEMSRRNIGAPSASWSRVSWWRQSRITLRWEGGSPRQTCAWAANGVIRSDSRCAAVMVHRPTSVLADDGPRP